MKTDAYKQFLNEYSQHHDLEFIPAMKNDNWKKPMFKTAPLSVGSLCTASTTESAIKAAKNCSVLMRVIIVFVYYKYH